MIKNYYMIIDTETCGDYVFDIGFKVIDREGTMCAEGSYLVREFIENPHTLNMFNDIFTKTKIGGYYFNLWQNTNAFKVMDFAQIMDKINTLAQIYNCTVCAYNIAFDINHLNKTSQMFGLGDFFNNDIRTIDIWHMAMSVLGTKKFVRFCMANDFITNAGNIKTDAETMYRYITKDINFEEAHTARADCEIESAIMVKCFNRKKHFETSTVGMCLHNKEWQRIQKSRN